MKIKRTVVLLLCAAMLATSLSACGKKADDASQSAEGDELDDTATLWTEDFTVTKSMMTYFFNSYYRNFVTKYEQYLTYLELDTTKTLAEQQYSEDYTWYNYMLLQVFDQVKQTLFLAEAANAEGMELGDEDYAEIDKSITNLNSAAEKSGYTNAGYIRALFGEEVNESTVRQCMKLQLLSTKYYDELTGAYSFSEEDCKNQFETDPDSYLYYDYIRAVVTKEQAEELAACKDEKSFVATQRQQLADASFSGDYKSNSEAIDELIDAKYCRRVAYNESSDFIIWGFDGERRAYDVFTKDETDGSGNVSVCMILPATGDDAYSDVLYRDSEPVANIKYILFGEKNYGSADGALEKANSVLDEYKSDATEENFDTLSGQYEGSVSNDIEHGELTALLENWIFDSARKPGDTGVVSIENTGTYLMYYLNSGDPAWIYETKSTLAENKFKDDIAALEEQYPSEYDKDVIYNISEVKIG